MKLAIMISGNLGMVVFKNLLKSQYTIVSVFTDNNSKEIIELSNKNRIICFIGNPRSGKTKDFVSEIEVDVLLSINYLYIIEEDLINLPSKLAINFHGSLLPKYRGRTPHVWSIINNEYECGITAHKITISCDAGDIMKQVVVPIKQNDTGADLLNKYLVLYPKMVNQLLKDVLERKTVFVKQNDKKATYFGSRTSEDGLIDWNWHKTRIRNWIRAQAHPYPGAFTFIEGSKIVIDKVDYDDYGFNENQPNGLLLSENPFRVKTPNGVLKLTIVRDGIDHLKQNKIFNIK